MGTLRDLVVGNLTLKAERPGVVLFCDEKQKWQKTTFDVLRHMDKRDGLLELHGDPR